MEGNAGALPRMTPMKYGWELRLILSGGSLRSTVASATPAYSGKK
jgi:hypothetical protein